MMGDLYRPGSGFHGPKPLMGIFLAEWRWWIPGAVFSFLMASVLMSGWPVGLTPNLDYPYTYQADGLSHSWLAQRAIEGWIFDNTRSGYPFGSNFLDYPGSDSGNILLLKLLGLASGDYYSAINLFFLLSFSAVFVASFCALNAIGLSRVFSFSAALLFAFLPFHFLRLGHLFYLWYFVVPLFFYAGFRIFFGQADDALKRHSPVAILGLFFGFIVLASFGVYYALFGVIVLGAAGLAAWIRNNSVSTTIIPAVLAVLVVIAGVLMNVGPNLVYKNNYGPNREVAVRLPAEAEIYGLKMTQLVLPRPGHRDRALRKLTDDYSNHFPLVNENYTASLGVVGTAGFFLLGLLALIKLAGGRVDERLAFLGIVVFVLFLFGTIGGLGALFSGAVSSSIRGWNRISVFIAFGSIAAFFLVIQLFVRRLFSTSRSKIILLASAVVVGTVGLYDQTVPACLPCNDQTKAAFELDRDFVRQIEKSVPDGVAIYQLPYMPFPEVAPLHRLDTYDLVAGYLHSKSLHWSYAGMKGRDGDLFYRSLAQEAIERQLEIIKRLGFAGIYVDRRGFEDNADALIGRLSAALGGPPTLRRADGEVVFFRVRPLADVDLRGLSSLQIMQKAGYVVDRLGARYPASFADGIDFTRQDWPEFVRDVNGLSGPESWGRWSDANVAPAVRFDFFSPLPRKFTLVLSAQPFGPNAGRELVIKIGEHEHRVRMQTGTSEARVAVELTDKQVDFVEFHAPHPASPQQIGISMDNRKLGVGFVRLRFIPWSE